jgi:hypothetical protein
MSDLNNPTTTIRVTATNSDGEVLDTFEVECDVVSGDGAQAKLAITHLASNIRAGVA